MHIFSTECMLLNFVVFGINSFWVGAHDDQHMEERFQSSGRYDFSESSTVGDNKWEIMTLSSWAYEGLRWTWLRQLTWICMRSGELLSSVESAAMNPYIITQLVMENMEYNPSTNKNITNKSLVSVSYLTLTLPGRPLILDLFCEADLARKLQSFHYNQVKQ